MSWRGLSNDFTTRLRSNMKSLPKPLASKGEWTAFLDEETTGLIYYFNSKTGESVWEAPTSSFPEIKLTSDKKNIMDNKRREYQVEQGVEYEPEAKKGATGVFGNFFGKPKEEPALVVDDTVVAESVAETIAENAEFGETKKTGFFGSVLRSLEESQVMTTSGGMTATEEPVLAETLEEETIEPNEDATPVKRAPLFSFGTGFGGGSKQFKGSREVSEEMVIEEGMSVEDDDMPDEMVEEALKVEKSFVFPDVLSVFKPKEPEVIAPSERVVAIETASRVLPSPEKVSWGGEDACFVIGRTFGVFDGVSGADKLDGIPLYSDTLAKQLQKVVPKNGLTIEEMTTVLTEAAEYADVAATGASTAVVGSIGEDGVLRALNLGDCAIVVLRDGKVAARTKEITHYFDCPYQLGEDSPDRPIDGTTLKTEVYPGDVIVAGSDGIFDNLLDNEIWDLVASSNGKASIIAKSIIDESRAVSLDTEAPTPYAKLAKKNRYPNYQSGLGGKVDDISCVVIKCT
eukprot:CAMPEP_0113577850 /NCGR_PEP_ID=MMETSP0015_2-20120614/29116_1 /TAXON_ID=2838 /ORGANISM="Odontella" /LENGTH=514 /DNA_ID=CAMNT_0000481513 /DNA_START=761 /DNA_END=2305 /DNA_ORIENTATION=+ /assembly_acc=CAM_ASM_000160